MSYEAPVSIAHYNHTAMPPDRRHIRTWLRRRWKSELLRLGGDLETNAPSLHGDRRALGDALARLEQALELALAD